MKRTLFLAALLSAGAALADESSPFKPMTETSQISVSNVASTPEQLTPLNACQQYVFYNTGTADAWVELATTSAAAVPDIPAAGNPGTSYLVRSGSIVTLTKFPQAWISAQTSSGTTTLNVACGLGGVLGMQAALATGTGASSQTVQGTAADGAAAVGSPVQIGIVDGSGNVQAMAGDTSGRPNVTLTVNATGLKEAPSTIAAQTHGGIPLVSSVLAAAADSYSLWLTGSALADGVNGNNEAAVIGWYYNGTTFDRVRGDTSGAFVQGPAASGAAAVGSPVQTGGTDGTNARAFRTDTTGRLFVKPAQNNAGADAFSNGNLAVFNNESGTTAILENAPSLFNGTTWDRQRTAGIGNGVAATGIAASSPYGEYLTNANQVAITTGQYTALQTDPAGNLRTAPQRPTAGDIVAGSVSVTSTTASTALITVSAGRTWVGDLCISVAGSKSANATGNGEVLGTFVTAGTNVVPAAGQIFEVDTAIGANAATGTVGTQGSNSDCLRNKPVVAPVGNAVTVNYTATCTSTTACRVSASANGVMQ